MTVEHQPEPAQDDPAAAYRTRAERRKAWEAWEAAGEPWPPPEGLLSASLSACMDRGRERDRWRR